MSTYLSTLTELKSDISKFKNKTVDLNSLKVSVWKAASEIVSVEEKELRMFLQRAEAELDSLQFTVDEEILFDETLKVVSGIESFLSKHSDDASTQDMAADE